MPHWLRSPHELVQSAVPTEPNNSNRLHGPVLRSRYSLKSAYSQIGSRIEHSPACRLTQEGERFPLVPQIPSPCQQSHSTELPQQPRPRAGLILLAARELP